MDKLTPGDLIGVNKDSYLVLDTLPPEYDSRVKAMEVCVCVLVPCPRLLMGFGDRWKSGPPKGLMMSAVWRSKWRN